MQARNPTAATWPELAACRGEPVVIFFPRSTSYDRARAFCDGCEVRAPCLERAMRAEQGQPAANRHGMCGGLTPTERARLRRRRTRQAARRSRA